MEISAKYGSNRPEVFCRKGVLRNFVILTGKHLCQSLFFNKVAGTWKPPVAAFGHKSISFSLSNKVKLWWCQLLKLWKRIQWLKMEILKKRNNAFVRRGKHWETGCVKKPIWQWTISYGNRQRGSFRYNISQKTLKVLQVCLLQWRYKFWLL